MTHNAEHKYGCYNHPPRQPVPLEAQDGWTVNGRRNIVTVTTVWAAVECAHDDRDTDSVCHGCCWVEGA